MRNVVAPAPWWLPGAHAQTIFPRLFRKVEIPATTREYVATPDGDAIAVERITGDAGAPRVVIFHGLEGGLHSPYARAFLADAARRNWSADLVLWRTCDGNPVNASARSYHSGASDDADAVIRNVLDADPDRRLLLVGVSLGGNVLLKWLGERGGDVPAQIRAAAAISVPFDLRAAAVHLESGVRRVYGRFFLKSLVSKALAKLDARPDVANRERVAIARTLREFDDAYTAPVHGFLNADDYYRRSSSMHYLGGVRTPTLLLSARDDPFLPEPVIADVEAVASANRFLEAVFPPAGGHVGFVSGRVPWRPEYWGERFALDWLEQRASIATLTNR